MPRPFGMQIVLPSDPTAAMQAATKQYADTKVATSSVGVANGVASLDASGDVPSSQMPLVLGVVQATSQSATVSPNAALGNLLDVTATGNITINAPSNPANGQSFRVNVLGSGANRTVTFSSTGIVASTGLTLGPYTVGSGLVLLSVLTYSSLRTTASWVLTACTVSA